MLEVGFSTDENVFERDGTCGFPALRIPAFRVGTLFMSSFISRDKETMDIQSAVKSEAVEQHGQNPVATRSEENAGFHGNTGEWCQREPFLRSDSPNHVAVVVEPSAEVVKSSLGTQQQQEEQKEQQQQQGGFVAIEIQSSEQHPKGAFVANEDAQPNTAIGVGDADSVGKLSEDDGKVCRMCHLSLTNPSETNTTEVMEAVELGCGCKADLALAHRRCAETWFKIKGNRTCEICGQLAPNVAAAGFDDCSYGRRSDERSENSVINSEAGEVRSFWHHRPICNFVLAFIVVILLLPWLFRIRLF